VKEEKKEGLSVLEQMRLSREKQRAKGSVAQLKPRLISQNTNEQKRLQEETRELERKRFEEQMIEQKRLEEELRAKQQAERKRLEHEKAAAKRQEEERLARIAENQRLKELEKKRKLQEEEEQERLAQQKQAEKERLISLPWDERNSYYLMEHFREASQLEIDSFILQKKCRIVVLLEKRAFSSEFPSIKLKVGFQQLYTVKDFNRFFQNMDSGVTEVYGKYLTLTYLMSNFDEVSQRILRFFQTVLLQYPSHKDYLALDEGYVDDLYELLEDVPQSYRKFLMKDSYYLPELHLKYQSRFQGMLGFGYTTSQPSEEQPTKLALSLRLDYGIIFGKKHLYRYMGGDFTRITLDENGKAMKLILELQDKKELVIAEEHFPSFYRYVLSDIKDRFDWNGTEVDRLDVLEEKQIKIYADMTDEDKIIVQVLYDYEEGTKEGFNHENQHLSLTAYKVEGYLKNLGILENGRIYFDLESESGQNFLSKGLPHLQNYSEVFIGESLKRLGTKTAMKFNLGVHVRNNLLEIDIESIHFPKEELAAVLLAYQQKKKFFKLKSGERIHLESDSLEELDKMLDLYHINRQDIHDGSLSLELYRAFSVDNLLAETSESIQAHRSELFKDVIARFSTLKQGTFPLAAKFNKLLRDYQKYGYQWLQTTREYGFNGILADDMGLGKTLQVLTLLNQIKKKGKTSLVICPASLILNWQDEINKFTPRLKAIPIHGPAKTRAELIQNWSDYDVLITSYDYIRRDAEKYKDCLFNYVILDEAQFIKNPKTKASLSVKQLKSKHRLALTGTPIENSLAELWSIFDFLMPGYLYNYSYFQQQFETPIVRDYDLEQQLELKKLISPFILRRTKKEVLTELPDKIEKTIPIEFAEEEQKLYLANLMAANDELHTKYEAGPINKIAALAMLTRMRQICCEPRILFENIDTPSSKVEACIDLLTNLKENNKKTLLFSTFTSVFDWVIPELEKAGISYHLLTGSTPKEERRSLVNQFQNDETDVFLISLKAGGTGLNLTAAEAVIHFDPWWNVSAQNQATDRAHRMGQENIVQVFKLIMKDSIEEKILKLQEQKKNLADTFVEGNEGTITTMSNEELMDLFKVS